MFLFLFAVWSIKLRILPSNPGVDEKTEFSYIILVSSSQEEEIQVESNRSSYQREGKSTKYY